MFASSDEELSADVRTRGYGFAGTVDAFLARPESELIGSLTDHHATLGPERAPSGQQERSWVETIRIVKDALDGAARLLKAVNAWGIVLEWELPFEGGRRPDVVLLAGAAVVIVEFKASPMSSAA